MHDFVKALPVTKSVCTRKTSMNMLTVKNFEKDTNTLIDPEKQMKKEEKEWEYEL